MIKIYKDIDELSQSAAEAFVKIANQSIRERGRFLTSLSGGNTPMKLYEKLADVKSTLPKGHRDNVSNVQGLDWTRVHFFWGDERCVPVDDAGNSYGQTKKVMFDKIGTTNIHRIMSEFTPAGASENYAQTLREFAEPPHAWPRFDLVLLGMGNDGHTASLFPGSPVEATSPTLPVTANYQDRPANRVTLTQIVFNSAREIWFLVAGKEKAEILFNVLNGEYKPDLYPAQLIKPTDGNLVWMVDEEAGSLL